MGNYKDLTGQKFGRLLVIQKAESYKSPKGQVQSRWLCKCDCGNAVIVHGSSLKKGTTESCGCKRTEIHTKHGYSTTRLYSIWQAMHHRCEDLKNIGYHRYGAEGKTVCDEWREFEPFYNWAMFHGYKEGLTIDRIDSTKGYSPDNCRWATMKEQQNNRRNNHRITHNGETYTLAEWAEIKSIKQATISSRLKRGWSIERALTTPVKY